jgi:hypothetical protein
MKNMFLGWVSFGEDEWAFAWLMESGWIFLDQRSGQAIHHPIPRWYPPNKAPVLDVEDLSKWNGEKPKPKPPFDSWSDPLQAEKDAKIARMQAEAMQNITPFKANPW